LRRVGVFLAAGSGVYLLILLANFPAAKLTGYLQQQYAPLAFHSVTGSVFSGSAARIEHDALVAGPVSWTFRPSGLLQGRLEYHLQGNAMQSPFSGNVAIGMDGSVHARDVEVRLEPAGLVELYSPIDFTVTGRMAVSIESLELRDGFPSQLTGHFGWTGAGVVEPVSIELGEVAVLLGSEPGRITGEVSNTGDARVAGSLSLSASRDYSVDLQLTPGRATSAEVVEFLESWARPEPGGSYRLVDNGRL
jgi:hypothetical protein